MSISPENQAHNVRDAHVNESRFIFVVSGRVRSVGVLGGGSHTTCNPPQSLSCDYQLSGSISNPSERNEGCQLTGSLGFHLARDKCV